MSKQLNIPPYATYSHAYLIVAGILLGVLAGPGVLGRIAPDAYRAVFDGADAQQLEADYQQALEEQIERVGDIDVSEVYITEISAQLRAVQHAKLEAGKQREQTRVATLGGAIVLTMLLVMILESALGPAPKSGRTEVTPQVGQLITVRYALMGLGVALLIASPTLLWAIPKPFLALLIIAALVIGLIPLGRSRS